MQTAYEQIGEQEKLLLSKLNTAFDGFKAAEVIKTQKNIKGRNIFLPLMALLATAVYVLCMIFTFRVNMEYRFFLVPIESIVYLFFMIRFGVLFYVDIISAKLAEKILIINGVGDDKKRYILGLSKFCRKFEYDGGFLVAWSDEKYDKFENKNSYSPLASRYERNIQRRSSNYVVFTAEFFFEKMIKGKFAVTENEASAILDEGEIKIIFDKGLIKKIIFLGKAETFYDSVSPISFFDSKLPFDYYFTYNFTYLNGVETITLPEVFKTAINDFLLPIPDERIIKF